MPRIQNLLYVGIYNSVVALDTKTGNEAWRVKLGGMSFVNVYFDGTDLFASSKGEVFCLDPKSGAMVWHNKLKGLGTGFVTLASTRAPAQPQQQVVTSAATKAAEASRTAAT
jgi:outer membrane protein assembly factor BamB